MGLPENIYPLSLDHPPDRRDADPDGNILFYSPHGWIVASYDEVTEVIAENNCTHWTYTPPLPPIHARHRSD
jgi:hypothetical protein